MDRNITNFNFLENTTECISKIGCWGYIQDLNLHHTQVKNKTSKEELPEVPDSIFDLEGGQEVWCSN